ncbi:MAG: insulinase family protein, partial [Bacteroidales bacterium]|nr:insulinase family protein [Bacteroidales bacterium]
MKRFLRLALIILALAMTMPLQAQQLKAFRLNNGMNVFVWEDHNKPDVFGEVVVRTGSVNDPSEYTGLAHYLEHVMFKGTTKIGTTDWAAEAPIYAEIIAKYDEMAEAADPAAKQALADEINNLTVEASGYGVANEYSNLIESIGGTGLNAATSFDETFFFNSFPANQLSRWLFLASERFINPVFRSFQTELETVYEEYNMTKDNPMTGEREFMLSTLFPGQPYGRPIIGLGEHLKNPRLSELIKFYEKWYVPSNMALILVGDIDANKSIRLINSTFGRIAPGPAPEAEPIAPYEIKGRTQFSYKGSQYPSLLLAYEGVPNNNPDAVALEICMGLLSNSMQTGLLDALSVDGVVMAAMASTASFAREGRCIIQAIPRYDSNQMSYESNRKLEKRLLAEVDKLVTGNISPWIFQSLKDGLCRDFDLAMENSSSRADFLRDIFVSGKDINQAMNYKNLVQALTIDDIKNVASKYLSSDNYVVICNDEGRTPKADKIAKPKYSPIQSRPGVSSDYAKWFNSVAAAEPVEKFVDWASVEEALVNDYSRLYYTPSEDSDVFSLIVRYGAGSSIFKKLEFAADLIDNAGIMGAYKPQALKERLARIGVTLNLRADDEYMYVTMRGYDKSLKDACQMLFQMVMMPEFEETQLDNLRGSILSTRYMRKRGLSTLSDALKEYLFYGKDSDYVNEVTDREVYDMTVSELTSTISQAAGYAADIFYTGLLPFNEVKDILSNNLPLVKGEKPQAAPRIRKLREVCKNTVYFLPNSDAQQAQIY